MISNATADRITCVIIHAFSECRIKLREKTPRVVGTKDCSVSEIIGRSGTNFLSWDTIHDGLVDLSVAEIVIFDVDAPMANADSCHIDGRGSLVCLKGARVLAEASVEVHLEHVLFLLNGHLFFVKSD